MKTITKTTVIFTFSDMIDFIVPKLQEAGKLPKGDVQTGGKTDDGSADPEYLEFSVMQETEEEV